MDADRRRLSLSLKRVEGGDERPHLVDAPGLGLSEEVFSDAYAEAAEGVPAAEADVESPADEAGDEGL